MKSVQSLHETLDDDCKKEMDRFSERAKETEELMFVPTTRVDFLCYATTLTLDPNTANYNLLTEDNSSVKPCKEPQPTALTSSPRCCGKK
ncbi:hypothetical protein J4Q44_G00190260 [Coregonus suidteri]|uniref:Uncharacterized protein n=1 Tax=Coregonus suidteri TaxID=861788 RepID=A0AAN8QTU9_9TELE